MNKIIVLLLAAALGLSLAACGAVSSADPPETNILAGNQTDIPVPDGSTVSTPEESQRTGANVLIAYFSMPEDVDTVDAVSGASIVVKDGEKLGNTEYVAMLIQQTVGGDLFRIKTVEEYPLDHDPLVDQASEEQNADFRSELATHVENFEQYEYVFLGFPNWWGDMPMAVYSFLEEYDFGAKTIIPFITHGGSRASRTVNTISELQPGALMMGNELVLSRNDVAESEETVVNWAQGLGINAKAELPQNGDSSTVLTAAADGMIYSFYGRLSVGSTDVDMLRAGNLPPTFYCYGTRDPFYEQFLANADAVEAAGVRIEHLELEGRPHGFGYREDWFDAYDAFLTDVFSNL